MTARTKLSFQLSQSQIDGLRATGEFLEIDFVTYNVTIPGDSQDYQVYGNLPGAQQDVGFHDATFTPSVTMVQTSKLHGDTPALCGVHPQPLAQCAQSQGNRCL